MVQMAPIHHFQHEHVQYVRYDVEGVPSAQRDGVQHVLHDEERRVPRGVQRGMEHCVQRGVPNDVEDVRYVLRDELRDSARLHN